MSQQETNYVSYKVFNGYAPKSGPRAMNIPINFTNDGDTQSVDLELAQTLDRLEFVQGVYIDNSNGTGPVTLTCAVSGQVVSCPSSNQGYFPLMMPNNPRFTVNADHTKVPSVNLLFVNFPIPAMVWKVQ